jgi:hypothetical protein
VPDRTLSDTELAPSGNRKTMRAEGAGRLCMGRMVAVVLMGVEATAQLAWRR